MKGAFALLLIGSLALGLQGCDPRSSGPIQPIRQALGGPIDVPTNFRVVSYGYPIQLAWSDNSSAESLFAVYRQANGGPSLEACTTGANGTFCSDSGAVAGNSYTYYLYAFSPIYGWSAPAGPLNVRTTPIEAPTNLSGSVVALNQVRLTWKDWSSDEEGFVVQRSTNGNEWDETSACFTGPDGTTCDATESTGATRYYRVWVRNHVTDAYSNVTSVYVGTPATPTNLQAVATSATQVSLSWTDNANNEQLYRVIRSSPTQTLVFELYPSSTSLNDNDLTPNTTYTYSVFAANAYGQTQAGPVQVVTAAPPNAPGNFAAVVVNGPQANLTWTDNSADETGFALERWKDGAQQRSWSVGANVTTTSDPGLSVGANYQYYLRSVNGTRQSAQVMASVSVPTAPAAPSGLVLRVASPTQINISWTDNSWNESLFRIERSTDGANYTFVTATGVNGTFHANGGLSTGTTYHYRLRAENPGGSSSYVTGSIQLAVPAAPTGVSAVASEGFVTVSWTDTSNNEDSFSVEQAVSGSSTWTTVCTTLANLPGCNGLNGFVVGTTYQFRVRAHNGAGSSVSSTVTLPYLLPAAPSGLSVKLGSPSSTVLTWTNNASNATAVMVETSQDGVSFQPLATRPASATTHTDSPVTVGATYFYRVYAQNGVGNSAYSNVASILVGPPAPPTGLSGAVASTIKVDLKWTDASSNEEGFRVERAPSGGSPWAVVCTAGAGGAACSDTTATSGSTYQYRVSAYNGAGTASSASITLTVAVPAAPGSLVGQLTAATAITLGWTDNSPNETGFKVERSTDGGTTFTQIGTTLANVTSYTNTGLTANSTYVYRVRAYNGVGNSSYTSNLSIKAGAPTAPSGLAGTLETVGIAVRLTWTDASNNETVFVVARAPNGGAFADVGSVPANTVSYTDSTVAAGATYQYRVRATNPAGASANSSTVTVAVVPPAAPSNLLAVQAFPTQINLSWTDNSTTETGFRVESSTDGVTFSPGVDTPANVTSRGETGVVAGQTYMFRVAAVNNVGVSAYSNVVTITAGPALTPANLVAWASSTTQASLSWYDASNNETGFKIERSTNGTTFTAAVTLNPNVTTWNDPGRTSGSQYWYRIRATSGGGDSPWSNVATVKMAAPGAPTNLVAVVASLSQVDLFWLDKSDGEKEFLIERKTGSGAFAQIAKAPANSEAFSDVTVTAATTYTYQIRASNTVGNSAYSNTFTVTVGIPAAPTGLVALVEKPTPTAPLQVGLTWTDNANNENHYVLERSLDGVTFAAVDDYLPINTNRFTDLTVERGITYHYRVLASNAIGPSAPSNVAVTKLQEPAAPSKLRGTVISSTQINLSWADNSLNESGFAVERGTSATNIVPITTVGRDVTTYNNTGLTANTTYFYRVRAQNGAGNSFYSPIVSVRTATPPAPTNLTALILSSSQVDLAWEDNAGNETSYTVERSADNTTFTQIGTTAFDTRTFRATGLTGSTHYFRIRATNGAGNVATPSLRVNMTVPAAPTGLTAAAQPNGSIRLTWTDASTNENGFRIERMSAGVAWAEINVAGQNVAEFTNTGLPPMVAYTFRVRAFNGLGNSSYATSGAVTPLARIVLAPACRIGTAIVFPYDNREDGPIPVAIGTDNRFANRLDRGQPRLFLKGKGAFKVDLAGESDTWTLTGSSQAGSPATATCATGTQGKRQTVTVGGVTYVVGLDETAAVAGSTVATQTFPGTNPDGTPGTFAAGAMEGGLSVSHDGVAGYQIPIATPSLPNGWRPRDLAVSYSSQGGNGLAGVGWNLQGGSAITRCSLHPTYGDVHPDTGDTIPAAFEWHDQGSGPSPTYALCLDGKRLIPDGNDTYRLEDDPSLRIKAFKCTPLADSPGSITVEDGSGNTSVYGGCTADPTTREEGPITQYGAWDQTLAVFPTSYTDPATPKRYSWLLTQAKDRFGQLINYRYVIPSQTPEEAALKGVERLLDVIEYGPGFNIKFDYERRDDASDRYVRGMRLAHTRRLTKVTVKHNTRVLSEHRFGYRYAPQTGRSLLATAQECDGSDASAACKRPLSFTYQEADLTYRPVGRRDIPLNGSDGNQALTTMGRQFAVGTADLDEDGRDDLLLMQRNVADPEKPKWGFSLSDGVGYGTLRPTDLPNGVRIEQQDYVNGSFWEDLITNGDLRLFAHQRWMVFSDLIVTDLNGDGRPEFGIRDNEWEGYRFWNIPIGAGGDGGPAIPYGPSAWNGMYYFKRILPYVGDLNGDGLPEIMSKDIGGKKWHVMLGMTSNPGHFDPQFAKGLDGNEYASLSFTRIDDIDGDGAVEMLAHSRNITPWQGERLIGLPSAGDKPLPPSRPSFQQGNGGSTRGWGLDANGDGLPDVVEAPARSYDGDVRNAPAGAAGHGVRPRFMENTGNGLRKHAGSNNQLPAPSPDDFDHWMLGESVIQDSRRFAYNQPWFVDNGVRAADIDGDGRQELLVLGERMGCWTQWEGDAPSCWSQNPDALHMKMKPRSPFLIKLGYDGKWYSSTIAGTENGGLPHSPPLVKSELVEEDGMYHITGAYGYRLTRIVDVDGDGIPEIIQPITVWEGNQVRSYLEVFRQGQLDPQTQKWVAKKADLLLGVTDSLGAKTEVAYAPMSDRTVFTPHTQTGITCQYPYGCPTRGPWLVKEVKRPTGLAAPLNRSEKHTYAEARSDLSGRGWLGMGKHVVAEPSRGRTTTYLRDNFTRIGKIYPYAGLVASEVVSYVPTQAEAEVGITETRVEKTTVWKNYAPEVDRVLVRPSASCVAQVTVKVATGPIWHSNLCTAYEDYDTFGYAKKETRTGGIDRRETVTTYDNSRASGTPRILGVVSRVEETSTVTGKTPVTRTVINAPYQPDFVGLTRTTTVEPQSAPGQPPLTLTTVVQHDQYGQPTEIQVTGDTAAPIPETTTWTPNVQTRVTRIHYDSFGHKSRVINPAGHEESFVHDGPTGLLVAHLDPNRLLTTYVYDGFGRKTLEKSEAAGEATYSYAYDAQKPDAPLVVSTVRWGLAFAHLGTSQVHHDILERPVRESVTQPRGRSSHILTQYDDRGRVSGTSAPRFDNDATAPIFGTILYDNLDRVTKRTEADGTNVTITYDGLTSKAIDGEQRQHVVIRHPSGLPLRSQSLDRQGQLKGQVIFEHGPFGQVEKMTKEINGVQVETQMTFDRLGRRTLVTDPDRKSTREAYNAFGELVHIKDTMAVQTLTHDSLGRVVTKQTTDGVTIFIHDLATNGIGKPSTSLGPDGVMTRNHYDALGRPTIQALVVPSLTGPGVAGTLETETVYDSNGRIDRVRYPAATATRRFEAVYEYSANAGALVIGVKDGAGKSLWRAEEFNPLGAVTQEFFGNKMRVVRDIDPRSGLIWGLQGGFGGAATAYPEGSPAPVPGLPPGTLLVQDERYDYDGVRNLRLRTERSRTLGGVGQDVNHEETYGYDDFNRLSSWLINLGDDEAVTYTFPYDDRGNLLGRVRTEGGGEVEWKFEYNDERPHAISKATVKGVETTFHYDSRGRRWFHGDRIVKYTEFDLPKTISTGTGVIATFDYDAFNTRVRKISNNEETVTFGLYERRAPSAALTAATHLYRVAGGAGVVAEVEWDAQGALKPDGERYLHGDRLGSIAVVTGSGTTQLLGRNRFEPYGNSVDPARPWLDAPQTIAGGTRRGFTGHEHDDELGLVNMNGRIYDPKSATFFTPDPVIPKLGWAHAFHPYSYVVNNPVNATDPTGFTPAWEQGGVHQGEGAWTDDNDPGATPGAGGPQQTRVDGENSGGGGGPEKVDPAKLKFTQLGQGCSRRAGYRCIGRARYEGRDVDVVERKTAASNGEDVELGAIGRYLLQKNITMNPDTRKAIEGALILSQGLSPFVGVVAARFLQSRASSAMASALGRFEAESAAEFGAARGLGRSGGIFAKTVNEAGGEVWTSSGVISQKEFATYVQSGSMKGEVNILSGVHGKPNGRMYMDVSLYEADVLRFGNAPGVNVHFVPDLTPPQITNILRGPGTTIGGFCDSGACLAPYK